MADKVKVRVLKDFRDKHWDKNWRSKHHVYETTPDRAKELVEKGLAEDFTEEKAAQEPTEKNKKAGPPQRKRAAE